MELYNFHLFAGAGGGILADQLSGHRTIGAVEIEPYPRRVLLQRQLDGFLPRFPVWDDVTTFGADNPDTAPYIERLRSVRDRLIISGGFPCQDISVAGKGAGIAGERSGLWKEMGRIIGEIRPRFVFVENSPMLIQRGLTTVLGDLAALGYDVEWCIVSASDVGAPHKRDRVWVMADSGQIGYGQEKEIQTRGDSSVGGGSLVADTQGISERKQTNKTNSIPNGRETRSQFVRRCKHMADTQGVGVQGERPQGEQVSNPHAQAGLPVCGGRGVEWWRTDPSTGATEPELGRVAHGVSNRVDRLKAIGNAQVPAVASIAWRILNDG